MGAGRVVAFFAIFRGWSEKEGRMRLLAVPICRNCGGGRSRVLKTAGNLARLAGAALAGLLAGDVVPVQWRCAACGEVYAAVGTRVVGGRATRGSTVDPAKGSAETRQARKLSAR